MIALRSLACHFLFHGRQSECLTLTASCNGRVLLSCKTSNVQQNDQQTKCEVCSAISFLNAMKFRPIEIYRQLSEVYGDLMNEASVRKWRMD